MNIIAIAAVGRNGELGIGGKLPWDLPEDMRFFRDSTRGQIVIMGRKTFDSLGKPLPKRENAVITRDRGLVIPGVKVFHDLESAVRFYQKSQEFMGRDLFVIGGAEIYRLSLPFVRELWLTEIDGDFVGDAFFPGYSEGCLNLPEFKKTSTRLGVECDSASHRYFFSVFRRANS
ncbi:MAG: dihydrofolate reductase [Bdellovibrionales bacterium]|nr:dihydrofolate reductase [Bdellovibrionales bacterium]